MNRITKQFVNLILEKEEKKEKKEEKPKTDSEQEKRQRKKKEAKEASSANVKVYKVQTDNSLAKGRPISDPSLANMKYRSNGEPSDAKAMLDELGISKPSSGEGLSALASLMNQASKGDMGVLIQNAELVKSQSGILGIKLSLNGLWKQDDKGGKRSFGFIRAVIAAANKAGYLSNVKATTIKTLRVEEASGENAFVVYSNKKAKSWGA